jgi:hypothetical protein
VQNRLSVEKFNTGDAAASSINLSVIYGGRLGSVYLAIACISYMLPGCNDDRLKFKSLVDVVYSIGGVCIHAV